MRNAQIRGRKVLRPEELTDKRSPLLVAQTKPPPWRRGQRGLGGHIRVSRR
jgi:hypothetical protein